VRALRVTQGENLLIMHLNLDRAAANQRKQLIAGVL